MDISGIEPFVAAAVQAAPVFLDTDATVGKVESLAREAASKGARLIAFPEVFVPGYPYWNWTMTPPQGGPWFERLALAAIEVPGPVTDRLGEIAKACDAYLVIGVNERAAHSIATLYNTVLTFAPDGSLLATHRKLVPTWAEKLTWAHGDGSSLKVHRTDIGPLGVLACGENTNTLARFALLAQGELVHVANYISLPVAPADYDMVEAIKVRSAAHSFEGKVFTVVACSTVSQEIIDMVAGNDEQARAMLSRPNSAFSGIIGPDGRLMGEGIIDVEGIAYAEIDLRRCIQPRQMHDIVGHYNRFDVFDLRVNTASQHPVDLSPWPTGDSLPTNVRGGDQ
ncbi:MAG: carbon-nitrogen hydrolase family protein [Ilumatobacteraceae bacterium]|jgi:nitrilase